MLNVNYTQFQNNLKTLLNKVTEEHETIIITGKKNKNIVMISEETYNNLMENMYIISNKFNYDWLMESKEQLKNCNV